MSKLNNRKRRNVPISKTKCLALAIGYIRQLQGSVQFLKDEIYRLEAASAAQEHEKLDGDLSCNEDVNSAFSLHTAASEDNDQIHEDILQLQVSKVETGVFSFRILSRDRHEALEKLVKTFECIDVDIENASITTWNRRLICYYLLKGKNWDMLSPEDVKQRFFDIYKDIERCT